MSDQTYWAARETDDCVAEADERVTAYYRHINTGDRGSLLHLWRASNRACFAGFYTGGEIGKLGKASEYRAIEVNEYGNLQQHLVTMITAQRPSFEVRTDKIDAQAQQQAPVAVAVIETALREKGLEDVTHMVADTMVRAGEGWAMKRWNYEAGEVYTAEPVTLEDGTPKIGEDGQPEMRAVRAGDVEYVAFHPLDVARDVTRPHREARWFIPRRRANRYDLAAEHPEFADAILGAPSIYEESRNRPQLIEADRVGILPGQADDDVWVYDLIHDRCPALPDGRLLSYVTTTAVLEDGPLPYAEMPLYRAAAKDLEGTAFGYSLLWDVLAPQMALNNVLSHITTLAADLGAVVWEPEGMGQSPSRWKGILTILKGGTVAPQVLDLMKIPAELFKLVEFYISSMERSSGINSIYRGQAQEGQKSLSGAAYALFAARAIEFGSGYQRAHAQFLEKIATGTISDYQSKGKGRYLVTTMGEGNAYRVEAFTGGRPDEANPEDGSAPHIHRVSKVAVKLTNPLQSTQAGRMQMFDSLKTIPGAITSPETALQVLNTGRLEPATQSAQRELENVAKEGERLAKGEPVAALITDRHWMHIPEHSAVAASPEARDVPGVVDAIAAHVTEHMDLMRGADPIVLAMMGCPPGLVSLLMAPPPGAMLPPGPPGAPPGDAGPVLPPPTPPGAAQVPGQPTMPTDPLTGQQAPAPTGAIA